MQRAADQFSVQRTARQHRVCPGQQFLQRFPVEGRVRGHFYLIAFQKLPQPCLRNTVRHHYGWHVHPSRCIIARQGGACKASVLSVHTEAEVIDHAGTFFCTSCAARSCAARAKALRRCHCGSRADRRDAQAFGFADDLNKNGLNV